MNNENTTQLQNDEIQYSTPKKEWTAPRMKIWNLRDYTKTGSLNVTDGSTGS